MMRVWLVTALLVLSASAHAQSAAWPTTAAPGIGIDSRGGPVVDPTKNVEDTVRAAVTRLDDLRAAQTLRLDDLRAAQTTLFQTELAASNKIGELRSQFDRELLKAAVDRLDENAKLRSEFQSIIAATEKARVDAIRLVDTGAVAIAAERTTTTAGALAKAVSDSALVLSAQATKQADDLRVLVKTTADEQSRNLQQQFGAIQTQFTGIGTRLTALEQSGAEGKGSARFQDPQIAALVTEVRAMRESSAVKTGTDTGRGDVVGWIVAGFLFIFTMVSTFAAIFVAMRKPTPAAASVPVVYQPAVPQPSSSKSGDG